MSDRVTPEFLHTILICYAETGRLWWRKRTPDMFTDGGHSAEHSCAKWNSKNAGKRALNCMSGGRAHGRIGRRTYNASRVIWAMTHGYWPQHIDHKNHDPSDDRIVNLRDCSHQDNIRNSSSSKGSSSKYLGVYRDTSRSKWAAAINPSGKKVALGRFACEREAARAYDTAARHHFGEYANLNFPNEA